GNGLSMPCTKPGGTAASFSGLMSLSPRNQAAPVDSACSDAACRPILAISALLTLADWVQRPLAQGGASCLPPRRWGSPPAVVKRTAEDATGAALGQLARAPSPGDSDHA